MNLEDRFDAALELAIMTGRVEGFLRDRMGATNVRPSMIVMPNGDTTVSWEWSSAYHENHKLNQHVSAFDLGLLKGVDGPKHRKQTIAVWLANIEVPSLPKDGD